MHSTMMELAQDEVACTGVRGIQGMRRSRSRASSMSSLTGKARSKVRAAKDYLNKNGLEGDGFATSLLRCASGSFGLDIQLPPMNNKLKMTRALPQQRMPTVAPLPTVEMPPARQAEEATIGAINVKQALLTACSSGALDAALEDVHKTRQLAQQAKAASDGKLDAVVATQALLKAASSGALDAALEDVHNARQPGGELDRARAKQILLTASATGALDAALEDMQRSRLEAASAGALEVALHNQMLPANDPTLHASWGGYIKIVKSLEVALHNQMRLANDPTLHASWGGYIKIVNSPDDMHKRRQLEQQAKDALLAASTNGKLDMASADSKNTRMQSHDAVQFSGRHFFGKEIHSYDEFYNLAGSDHEHFDDEILTTKEHRSFFGREIESYEEFYNLVGGDHELLDDEHSQMVKSKTVGSTAAQPRYFYCKEMQSYEEFFNLVGGDHEELDDCCA